MTKDDLISRQAAIDAIDAVMPVDPNKSEYASGIACGAALAMTYVKQLPSADRPQGEWVDAEIPLESGDTMPIQVCNLCKKFYPLAYTGGGHRFCPTCGARMKGADDE